MKKLFLCLILGLAFHVSAQEQDLPKPEEAFPTYFARLTRSGSFNGIFLKAPEKFQTEFLHFIPLGYWVGKVDREISRLQDLGINFWSGWMTESKPLGIIFNSVPTLQTAKESYDRWTSSGQAPCKAECPAFELVLKTEWSKETLVNRATLIEFLVTKVPIFNQSRLVDLVGDSYQLSGTQLATNTKVKILPHEQFVIAVREMGWTSDIYFRGITGPDPTDATKHWICLDLDFLIRYSDFDSEIFRLLEIVEILTHEFNHVAQDLRGRQLGINVTVSSAETQLIIEGMAETLAETEFRKAGELIGGIQPWTLFSYEQAVNLKNKQEGGSSGIYFPYKIGMPFVATLYAHAVSTNQDMNGLTDRLLHFLDFNAGGPVHGTKELEQLLSDFN